MKLLLRTFLSVCLLFVSGFDTGFARDAGYKAFLTDTHGSAAHEGTRMLKEQGHSTHSGFFAAAPEDERDPFFAEETENESVDIPPIRRVYEENNYFTSLFAIQSDCGDHCSRLPLPFCEHLSFSSSRKCIFLRVIRI